jgi:hypothetical protein
MAAAQNGTSGVLATASMLGVGRLCPRREPAVWDGSRLVHQFVEQDSFRAGLLGECRTDPSAGSQSSDRGAASSSSQSFCPFFWPSVLVRVRVPPPPSPRVGFRAASGRLMPVATCLVFR